MTASVEGLGHNFSDRGAGADGYGWVGLEIR